MVDVGVKERPVQQLQRRQKQKMLVPEEPGGIAASAKRAGVGLLLKYSDVIVESALVPQTNPIGLRW